MMTANNGILIVALAFAYGVHANSQPLIVLAFAMAGISYLANIADDWAADGMRSAAPWAARFKWLAIATGVLTYAVAALTVVGY